MQPTEPTIAAREGETGARKYWIRENPNNTNTLMRYDEEKGTPNNAEYQFWCDLRAEQQENALLRIGPAEAGWWSPETAKAYQVGLDRLRSELRQKEEAIAKLQRDLDEARKDKERLDWLQESNASVIGNGRVIQHHFRNESETLREAIDAARKDSHV
jgi:hypothetical protein